MNTYVYNWSAIAWDLLLVNIGLLHFNDNIMPIMLFNDSI